METERVHCVERRKLTVQASKPGNDPNTASQSEQAAGGMQSPGTEYSRSQNMKDGRKYPEQRHMWNEEDAGGAKLGRMGTEQSRKFK